MAFEANGARRWFTKRPPITFKYDDVPDLAGQVAVITGPSAGVGKATVLELAKKGARVICLGRSREKSMAVIEDVMKATGNKDIEFVQCDLLDLRSVDTAADEVLAKNVPLDMLILNAGIVGALGSMEVSKDGIEKQWATNHFAHFHLTNRLLPAVERVAESGKPARIVAVASGAHVLAGYKEGIRFDKYNDPKAYEMFNRYAETKLANILMIKELQRRLEEKHGKDVRIFCNSCHPGTVASELGSDKLPSFLRGVDAAVRGALMLSPQAGAMSSVYLAASPEIISKNLRGQYIMDRARPALPGDLHAQATNGDLAAKLWTWSEEIVKEKLSKTKQTI